MDDALRGIIRNRAYGTQVRNYSGLRFGKITATDIDGLIEYHNKGYVLFETKYKHAEMERGQRLALERLCDDLQKRKPTLLVVCSHDTAEDIDVAQCEIAEYRFERKWRWRDGTVKELVVPFIAWLDNFQSMQESNHASG